jgi:hypothetical protein
MKLIAALPMLTIACSTIPAPEPVIPARVAEGEAEQLYEAYKLVCDGGECKQGDQTFDVTAFERTTFAAPRRVLSSNRHARNGVSWGLIGLGFGGAWASAMSFLLGDGDGASRTRGFGLAGGAAASLLLGILVRAVWPEPTETFETAYNQALAVELKKRVVGDPTALQAPRELTATEKECIRRKSSSPIIFEKISMGRCIARR